MLPLNRALLATSLVAAALGALLSSSYMGVAAHLLPRMSGLRSRQVSGTVPERCAYSCDDFTYTFNNCTTTECSCTNQIIGLALTCFDCIGDVANGQAEINLIAAACKEDGYPVGDPTVTPDSTSTLKNNITPTPTGPTKGN